MGQTRAEMSMDYKVSTYRPNRPDTRKMTSYGCMSTWMHRQKQLAYFKSRRSLADIVYPLEERRPIIVPAPLGMPTMYDTYIGRHLPYTPYQNNVGRESWPTGAPVHGCHPVDPSSCHSGTWPHVKEVMQAEGKRLVFVDGQVAVNKSIRKGNSQVEGGELRLPDTAVSQRVSSRNGARKAQHGRVGVDNCLAKPIARYDMIDVKKAIEKDNWSILR